MRGTLTENDKKFLDYTALDKEIKSLKIAKNALLKEQDVQIIKNSKLVEEEIKLTEVIKAKTNEANETARAIIEKARDIERGISKKNSEATTKLGEALELERKAKDLIKSNEGREKNLIAEKECYIALRKKLEAVKDLIKANLGG